MGASNDRDLHMSIFAANPRRNGPNGIPIFPDKMLGNVKSVCAMAKSRAEK